MFSRYLRRSVLALSGLAAGFIIAAPQLTHASLPPSYLPPASSSSSSSVIVPFTRPYKVAIQVGHYKNNELPPELSRLVGSTGTYGGGRSEVDLNLDTSNRIVRLLRAQGITVEMLPATVPTGYT